jgi:uncharacterized protein (TIGR00266 family)
MEISVRHSPSFAAGRVTLAGNEAVRVESGAMMATSAGIVVEAKMEGGFMKSLKRAALGGESLFITTYTAGPAGGWVDVAANLPGDIIVAGVTPDQPMFITRGSWLCSSAGVDLDTKWGGFSNLFGGEGGFLVRATGHGTIALACYGALDTVQLGPGEQLVVDTGHVVAYAPTVTTQLRKVAGGAIQSMKSGEGLVFDFTGPGWVMIQSRNPSALIQWLTGVLPFSRG